MNRTAIIYRPDPDRQEYILALIYTDRSPVRRLYTDLRDMRSDILEHFALDTPCVCYGENYDGELTGLMLGIVSEEGRLNIRYNAAAEIGDVVREIFDGITIRDILRVRRAAS